MSPTTLSNLVRISARFTRSVNLERDFFSSAGIEGYVLTTTARSTLRRVARGLTRPGGARAWTLTGPFGSGKSAFALYLANLLTEDESARDALKSEETDLFRTLFDNRTKTALPKGRFLPILATGAREPVASAILRGLRKSLLYLGTARAEKLVPIVTEKLESELPLGERALVELLEQVLHELTSANEITGMILILDELGKHLEYAALNSDSGDLYVLQSLAEMAQRNKQAPVIMLTLLHQSFERYAERLTSLERAEWSKVQGRFEDVAFQESLEQVLRLISGAIEFVGTEETAESWHRSAAALAGEAENLNLRPSTVDSDVFKEQLMGVYPLHPTVAFVLGPLFRKLAQNERSLFAFLSAHEPYGFQDFLLTTKFQADGRAVYTIDRLYDYVVQAFGGGLFNTPSGRRWAEIESSLARLEPEEHLQRRLVKAVGMLSVIGQLGDLKANAATISYAIDETPQALAPMIEELCDRSILVYRGFQEAYGLWEGSDFDLEEKLRAARAQVSLEETISELLRREQPVRPLVARRHSIQTGTLRYFEIRYALAEELPQIASEPLADADGTLIFVFATSDSQRAGVRQFAEELKNRPEILLVEPESTPVLHGYLHDLSCLRWLVRNANELAGDAVARREVYARVSELQQTLKLFLDSLLDQTSSSGRWFHKGNSLRIQTRRQLTSMLSTICDEVYYHTPKIFNELLNRRSVSTSAAAARNVLLEAMLGCPGTQSLGMKGHPPARSIHESLFVLPGIHREVQGRWCFTAPAPDTDAGTRELWSQMEAFLEGCEGRRRSVEDLFNALQAPPFGMKIGCLPVYLCAFLIARQSEAALYEEDAFIPSLTLPHLERLIKTPGKFKMQRFRIEGVRSQVFEKYLDAFRMGDGFERDATDILEVVRPLCHFAASLPEYSRNTQQLSEIAMKVRRALFIAAEPAKLLFEALPEACGVGRFEVSGKPEDVEKFFGRLGEAIRELQHTYDRLLEDIEQKFCQTFSLRGQGEEARQEFRKQAGGVTSLALDDQLKSFLLRATDDRLEIKGWVESIATVLVSKPPKGWNDKDRAVFEVNLRELARKYNQLEALALEVEGGLLSLEGEEVLCVGITDSRAEHVQQVVRVPKRDSQRLDATQAKLEEWIAKELGDSVELRLALLARLSKKFIGHIANPDLKPSEEPQLLLDNVADDT